jgi:hydrophobic/amphiphilic exporter-1 (mainly G- bacteria), HAE1 family
MSFMSERPFRRPRRTRRQATSLEVRLGMHPIETIVRNPVKVSVGVLVVALFGVVAVLRMPMQLTPEVQNPVVSVRTMWTGASPMEIEQEIILQQEEQLKSVEGVVKMSADCMDSMGTITLEFAVGTDMREALLKVSNRLQQVREYPVDADQPVITTSSTSDRSIAWFILSSRIPSPETIESFAQEYPETREVLQRVMRAHAPGLAEMRLREAAERFPEVAQQLLPPPEDVTALRRFAENFIEARFERVQGVSDATVSGGRVAELQVIVDPRKLAARGLTITDLRDGLQRHNQDTSAGDVWEDKRRYVVRTLGQFRSPQQVESLAIRVENGEPIYVRDVAEVRMGMKKPDGFVRRYGSNCIAISIVRDTGANVLDVMEGLRQAMDELNRGLLQENGLILHQVYDETDYILSAVRLVNENIILGSALTIAVLMLFLHPGWLANLATPLLAASAVAALLVSPWFFLLTLLLIFGGGFWFARGALVVGLAIPISIIGTFLFLQQLGRSLNVISLAGLAFAVGMLVDNAVVVLENIYRHFQRGDHPLRAAVHGVTEVWGAVMASTLTTLAVFIPVLFVEEQAGQLFRDIALAISAAVSLSLVVSITVIPTAASRLLGGKQRPPAENRSNPGSRRGWATRFVDGWIAINAWALGGVGRKIVVAATLIGISLGGSYLLWPKVEYLPTGNRNLVFCSLSPPPGYNLDQLARMGELIEEKFRPYWDVDRDSPEAAALDFPPLEDFFYIARGRNVFMGMRAMEPNRVNELLPLFDTIRDDLPGTTLLANKSSLFERGLTAGRSIDVEITGPQLERLVEIGDMILNRVGDVVSHPDVVWENGEWVERVVQAQARAVPSLDLSSPEIHVIPRMEQAAELGLTAGDLGYTVNALVDGAYAGDYMDRGFQIDLTLVGNQNYLNHTQDIEGLPLATGMGSVVPIGAVAQIIHSSGPEQVSHRERQRAITIQVAPPARIPLEEAIQRIESQILDPLRESGVVGADYSITLSGSADKLRQTWTAMRWNLLLATIITYLLMAALFESWKHPLVIMLSVPLGAVGGILALRLLNVYLDWRHELPQSLDILTMLGFVILIGTVVNNAILIVHQSLNHIRLEGMDERTAILESVRVRIRPIFMTTATTVLGLSPLVFFPGAGSELYRGLGSVVLGGLIVSTTFTLVLVPVMFSLMLDLERLVRPSSTPNGGATSWDECSDSSDENTSTPEEAAEAVAI